MIKDVPRRFRSGCIFGMSPLRRRMGLTEVVDHPLQTGLETAIGWRS